MKVFLITGLAFVAILLAGVAFFASRDRSALAARNDGSSAQAAAATANAQEPPALDEHATQPSQNAGATPAAGEALVADQHPASTRTQAAGASLRETLDAVQFGDSKPPFEPLPPVTDPSAGAPELVALMLSDPTTFDSKVHGWGQEELKSNYQALEGELNLQLKGELPADRLKLDEKQLDTLKAQVDLLGSLITK
jgi:hypothetical protein